MTSQALTKIHYAPSANQKRDSAGSMLGLYSGEKRELISRTVAGDGVACVAAGRVTKSPV